MNNIKSISIFMITMLVITINATIPNNISNLRRLLQHEQAPIAKDDGPITVPAGGEVIIAVTNNDVDQNGGTLTINEIVDEPNEGTVDVVYPNNIRYTPDPFDCDNILPKTSINDEFTYTVIEHTYSGPLVSNEATVSIEITCQNPAEPTSEPTPPPTSKPIAQCQYTLNSCLDDGDNDELAAYYECSGQSLYKYTCPANNRCDDGYGFMEMIEGCKEESLPQDYEACCIPQDCDVNLNGCEVSEGFIISYGCFADTLHKYTCLESAGNSCQDGAGFDEIVRGCTEEDMPEKSESCC